MEKKMERWKANLYTIWFSQILSLMSFGFGIPFLPFYIQEMGITDPDKVKIYTGILSAAPAVTMAVMAPIWGILSDRWGKKLMLLRAMLFASFIIGGMGLATRVEHLIILRFAQGMFTGTITASSALIASSTPGKQLSFALGFLSSSTFIGFSAGPIIGGFFAEYVGYRPSFFLGAALMMADFFLVLFTVKEGRDMALTHREEKKEAPSFASVFFSKNLVIMLLVLFFMRISRTVFAPYLPLFVQEVRLGVDGASRITGIISGIIGFMTALSGLTISRFGDRYNKVKLLRTLLAVSIILSLPLVFIRDLWIFSLVYAIFFFAVGGLEPVIMTMTSENTPAEKRGTLFGIQGLVGSVGWAVSPVLGSMISIRLSIQSVLLIIPLILFLGLIIVFILRAEEQKICCSQE